MPWGDKTVESLREEFLCAANICTNFSSLCREFGITRRTGYKWLKRDADSETLSNKSHAAKTIANKTSNETEQLILSIRTDNPAWGGKTIKSVLETMGCENIPSIKTCNNILKRNNCINPAESLKHKPYQRFEKEHCNEMWQTDFKGDFVLLDGTRCFPLTILDDHSRFSIMIDPKDNTRGVKDSFCNAFKRFGMPNSILSDNGAQFSGFRGGYTQFERWLMDCNILPIHGRIMHPQAQGKIERFHRTMKQELLIHNEFYDLSDADNHLQKWRIKYNEIRPHEALGMKCPADVYKESTRNYTDEIIGYDYGGMYPMRKVNNWGYLRFDKWQVYLSETMANTHLEIRPNPHGDSFIVCYRNFKIAELDAQNGKLINRKISRA